MMRTQHVALLAALLACAAAASETADHPDCPCGPFDQPDRVVREGAIDFAEARTVSGIEVYLANTSLRAGRSDAPFVIAGSGDPAAGRVRFQARQTITLGPGFHARKGSVFEASLVPLASARVAPSVWPADTEAADRSPAATTTVVAGDPAAEPPDPNRIEPMRPPRRPQLIPPK
jgi:hypothetical protein